MLFLPHTRRLLPTSNYTTALTPTPYPTTSFPSPLLSHRFPLILLFFFTLQIFSFIIIIFPKTHQPLIAADKPLPTDDFFFPLLFFNFPIFLSLSHCAILFYFIFFPSFHSHFFFSYFQNLKLCKGFF